MTNDTDHPDAGFRRDIEAKLGEGTRLTRADGVRLFDAEDLVWLGRMAHGARSACHPDRVTFVHGDESTCPQRCAFCTESDGRWIAGTHVASDDAWEAWSTTHGDGRLAVAAVPVHHGESTTDRVDRLLRLRDLQDDGGGFIAVAPLRVEHPDGPGSMAQAAEALRAFAVARLMIDNVDHVQSHWPSHGLDVAGLSLNFGACDLSGSLTRYRTTHDTDLVDGELAQEDVVELIQDAGFTPVHRDDVFGQVCEFDPPVPAAVRRAEPQKVWT